MEEKWREGWRLTDKAVCQISVRTRMGAASTEERDHDGRR